MMLNPHVDAVATTDTGVGSITLHTTRSALNGKTRNFTVR